MPTAARVARNIASGVARSEVDGAGPLLDDDDPALAQEASSDSIVIVNEEELEAMHGHGARTDIINNVGKSESCMVSRER